LSSESNVAAQSVNKFENKIESLAIQEFKKKVTYLSKRLQKKKDLIKKIEKKSYERKIKLKRCQEISFTEKNRKDIPKDKNQVIKVKCIELVLNKDNLSEQLKIGSLSSKIKDNRMIECCDQDIELGTKNRESSGLDDKVKLDNPMHYIDELLTGSDDDQEKIQHDREKHLKPLDVNLTCDDVIDTIEKDKETNVQLNDADADTDFSEPDELLNIREFIENTGIVRSIIKDIISGAVQTSSDNLYNQSTESCSNSLPFMIIDNSNQEKLESGGRPAELHHFNLRVRDAVREELLRYYQGAPGQQFRILDENHFTELCRNFSHEFREQLKESYIARSGGLEGMSLTRDNKNYITEKIGQYLSKM